MNYLIVANGPFLPKSIIMELITETTVMIALDGACEALACLGLLPDIILGDFDSVTNKKRWGIQLAHLQPSEPYLGKYGVTLVPAMNQNFTDLVKAIRYCDQHGAHAIDIVCATGGRMDHTLCNLRSLRSEYSPNRSMTLHTHCQSLRYVCDQSVITSGEIGDKCGVMAFPKGQLTSNGLVWECEQFPLEFGHSESVSNQLNALHAQLDVKGEALLVQPAQLVSQRAFQAKSQTEQLALLLEQTQYELLETTAETLKQGAFTPIHILNPSEDELPQLPSETSVLIVVRSI